MWIHYKLIKNRIDVILYRKIVVFMKNIDNNKNKIYKIYLKNI